MSEQIITHGKHRSSETNKNKWGEDVITSATAQKFAYKVGVGINPQYVRKVLIQDVDRFDHMDQITKQKFFKKVKKVSVLLAWPNSEKGEERTVLDLYEDIAAHATILNASQYLLECVHHQLPDEIYSKSIKDDGAEISAIMHRWLQSIKSRGSYTPASELEKKLEAEFAEKTAKLTKIIEEYEHKTKAVKKE